ncbi:PepSY domain-containing protein [Aquisalibacillus elongatus]|uniref:Putative membrane protein YkoI n=1 Tax=Aquisalibacillus elongatus TaxID=485577 RepID=A0A3N5BYL9_9BACI|nr:PepSY domain-containing protein [Aquisalibacillus elongatus]RPF52262.1 putative membrane protein YkoI [Aquisalibacillus elongatus]
MKRKLIAGAIASSVAVGGTVGSVALSDSLTSKHSLNEKAEVESDMETVKLDTKKLIGVEELQDIVSGEVEGTIEEVELETKNSNNAYFEVQVQNGDQEYELYIDAYTGKVLKVEDRKEDSQKKSNVNSSDNRDQQEKQSQNKETKQVNKQDNSKENYDDDQHDNDERDDQESSKDPVKKAKDDQKKMINHEQAIKLALEVASGKVSEVELDEDDGMMIYQVELEGQTETEIKINANTGEILEVERD